jgi:hypothetical protein
MGTSNDLYADATLPDVSLLAVVDIGPYADANAPAAFDGLSQCQVDEEIFWNYYFLPADPYFLHHR